MAIRSRLRSAAVSVFLAALLATLASCGGSSNSTSGGGGPGLASASISGNVNSSVVSNESLRHDSLGTALLNMLVPESQAAGMAGVNVELYLGSTLVDSQTTGNSGGFTFSGLVPGSYTIRIVQDGLTLGSTPAIEVNENTKTKIELSMEGSLMEMEVEAVGDKISGEIEIDKDDDSSSDDKSDDHKSEDDNSEDDKSEDDKSQDDDSEDDDSEDEKSEDDD